MEHLKWADDAYLFEKWMSDVKMAEQKEAEALEIREEIARGEKIFNLTGTYPI